jgi:uncharacterized membrane protein YraQ (UPF0718 family)
VDKVLATLLGIPMPFCSCSAVPLFIGIVESDVPRFPCQHRRSDNPLALPIAVNIRIPLYSNTGGMIPIMEVLTAKGIAMDTALAFMMAGIRLSLPEMIILR